MVKRRGVARKRLKWIPRSVGRVRRASLAFNSRARQLMTVGGRRWVRESGQIENDVGGKYCSRTAVVDALYVARASVIFHNPRSSGEIHSGAIPWNRRLVRSAAGNAGW